MSTHTYTNLLSTNDIPESSPLRTLYHTMVTNGNSSSRAKYKKLICLLNTIHPFFKNNFHAITFYNQDICHRTLIPSITKFIDLVNTKLTGNNNHILELDIPENCLLTEQIDSKFERQLLQSTTRMASALKKIVWNLPITATIGAISLTPHPVSSIAHNTAYLYAKSDPYKLLVELAILPYMTYNMRNIFLFSQYDMIRCPILFLKAGYSLFILNELNRRYPTKFTPEKINIYVDYIQNYIPYTTSLTRQTLSPTNFNALKVTESATGGSKKKTKSKSKTTSKSKSKTKKV